MLKNIISQIDQYLAPWGLGSYYLFYYLIFFLLATLLLWGLLKFRSKIVSGVKAIIVILIIFFSVRIVTLENPWIWKWYLNTLYPQLVQVGLNGLLSEKIKSFNRSLYPKNIDYLVLGSSQVLLFDHPWEINKEVFSIPGLKPSEYESYREYIDNYNPRYLILYLSEMDMTQHPDPSVYLVAPSNSFSGLWRLNKKIHDNFPGVKLEIQNIIFSFFFPEYRFNFIFRELLNKTMRDITNKFSNDKNGGTSGNTLENKLILFNSRFHGLDIDKRINLQLSFLEDFIKSFNTERVKIIILEGQYNPNTYNKENREKNILICKIFSDLSIKYPNVVFIPKMKLYQFQSKDFADLTHVSHEAGMIYTYCLSYFLDKRKIGKPFFKSVSLKVINKNGIEDWGFWIGNGDTEVITSSPQAGKGIFKGWFTPGPSIPGTSKRRLLLTMPNGYSANIFIDKEGPYQFTFPVTVGLNRLTLRSLDQPTLLTQANGDTRPLLVGVRGLTYDFANEIQ